VGSYHRQCKKIHKRKIIYNTLEQYFIIQMRSQLSRKKGLYKLKSDF